MQWINCWTSQARFPGSAESNEMDGLTNISKKSSCRTMSRTNFVDRQIVGT